MIKGIEIKNIPVEKIKIGDEEFKPKDRDFYENWSLRIKKDGIKKPFLVTKIGEYYMLYNCLNKFTIAKIIGLKEVPCKIITNKMMNHRIKQLNFSRRDHKLKEIEL